MELIKEIHQYLSEDLKIVNAKIISSLAVEEELVKVISTYLSESGGKRLRPVLTLLSAKLFGYRGEGSTNLATAIEFIHMATLLHDDVVDGSKMRRFLPSANVVWGSKASILVGDFLFSQSFKLIVQTESLDALSVLSSAAAIIAEGEVSQLAKLQEKRLITEVEYLKIIKAKTAELFASACEVGAIISGQSEEVCSDLRVFGDNLGCIFQVTDDLLDYFSDQTKMGKNIGDDFMEGKVTLPLILLHKKMPEADRLKLEQLIWSEEKSVTDFAWVKEKLDEFQIKQETMTHLDQFHASAKKALMAISGDAKCKEYLQSLLDFAMNRSY